MGEKINFINKEEREGFSKAGITRNDKPVQNKPTQDKPTQNKTENK